MRICIFEDRGAIDLEPLTLTRPVFDLWCGLSPLGERVCEIFRPTELGFVVRPMLAPVVAEQRPGTPINDFDWLRSQRIVLVNARWMPPADFHPDSYFQDGPLVTTCNGAVVAAAVESKHLDDFALTTLDQLLEDWKHTLPRREVGGSLIHRPWDLVERNAGQINDDFAARRPQFPIEAVHHIALLGSNCSLCIAPGAQVEPYVVADTRKGPVVIDRDAVIGAFTRLEGPCYIGQRTQLFGAKVRAGSTIGPNCRIGGEVEASIIQGNSNKYHEGFLGHSYVGEWVNIGAGAQTSDLRHDYGEVIVSVGGMRVPTGSSKVGSFIGDHSKIGLGALLNSGTMIGAFAAILPAGRLLPKNVPSFCSVLHGEVAENEDIDVLFATASEVMARRGMRLTPAQSELYRNVYLQTATQRKQALPQTEPRRLRRSA